ncbi:MAG: hypothetical protein KatS3mg010_1815 [Acidimicrobiia bacterium]|nr:MAG: hypothetical protein KatS3mg010_1815 [Acidimicrobiia bacterium]
MTAVHQFVPTLAPHDAVSTHYLAMQSALREAGYRSEIYAHELKPEMRRRGRHYRAYKGPRRDEPTWLCYHSSVGSPVAEFVLERPEPLLLDYHNITPAEFFLRWEPFVAGTLSLGRRQLARLAPRARLGMADSGYNAEELASFGCERTAVVPIMLDVASLERDADPVRRRATSTRCASAAAGTGCSSGASHPTRRSTTSSRRSAPTGASSTRTPSCTSSAPRRRTATSARCATSSTRLGSAAPCTSPARSPTSSSAAYYRHSDVMVVCSEHEGFCLPLLEAMHAGLPVVAYAAAAVPETLGDAGLLLDAKDACTVATAVARVLRDDRLRQHLVDAGRHRLSEFDIRRSRERLLDAIAGTVGPP